MTSRIKKILYVSAALLFTMVLVAGTLSHSFYAYISTPLSENKTSQVFLISSGESLSVIADNLEKNGLIEKARYFKLLAVFKRADKKLQAGEYLLSASQSPSQILTTLLSGKVKLYKITIPEGYNMVEIAQTIASAGFCNEKSFLDLCCDPNFISALGINALSLEGYLFPDTYFFPKNSSCKTIIRTMTNNFNHVFTDLWKNRAAVLNRSVHEIVILASIIEKETGDPKERPLISSVFHNRLRKGMRLESDPTVIYGIKNFDGNIKKKHLRTRTPYNTYQIKGLPPGPIANPGAKAIEAALFPAKSDYIFFVSKKDTTHYFSKTIKEHNQAVRKYQLGKTN